MSPFSGRRPFYGEYAWAYNLLIDRPVRKECGTIAAWLAGRHVYPGATILDAGCGTGRYAVELARRGYVVDGIDSAPDLVAEAVKSIADRPLAVSFAVGDIRALPAGRYDAILCRGVLNDLVDAHDRTSIFRVFRRALRPRGIVVCDVREWHATAERKRREPLFRKSVPTERGILTFRSITTLDPADRRLHVAERHTLAGSDGERTSDYEFVMQCWPEEELAAALRDAAFIAVQRFGAYDAAVPAGATDRLVVIAEAGPLGV